MARTTEDNAKPGITCC